MKETILRSGIDRRTLLSTAGVTSSPIPAALIQDYFNFERYRRFILRHGEDERGGAATSLSCAAST